MTAASPVEVWLAVWVNVLDGISLADEVVHLSVEEVGSRPSSIDDAAAALVGRAGATVIEVCSGT